MPRASRPLLASARPASRTTRITAYGCEPDEAETLHEIARRFGVRLASTPEPVAEANADLAQGARCVSVGHKTHVTTSTLRALRRVGVRYLSTRSIGCNHIDLPYAERLGICVENVTYSPASVADYTLMLMLMAVRHTKAVLHRTDAHDYRRQGTRGRELRDLTVGVVGTGRIGAAVLTRLQGFACRTLAHDTRHTEPAPYVALDELLARSDIVTLHTPLTPATYHLLDRRRIEQMRPGALVINAGRGALIDTGALLAALVSGHLGGAALDVVEGEDGIFYTDRRGQPVDNEPLLRLQRLPNVIVSPHIAYDTDHALRDMAENTIRNCMLFAEERSPWTG